MKYVIGYDGDGRILFAQKSPVASHVPDGLLSIEVTEGIYNLVVHSIGTERFFVSREHNSIVGSEARPSRYHVFNWTTKQWEEDIATAVISRKAEIDIERARRNQDVIIYDGKRLDADAVAQKNLADKLAGVKERIRLGVGMAPELMVWKDADNILHVWDTLQEYCDWLAGLAIALEDRGTRIYTAAWAHKSAIDLKAAVSISEVIEHDVRAGWPT